MRKTSPIVLVVVLAFLLFGVPTVLVAETAEASAANVVHLVPSGSLSGRTVTIVGRMWTGTTIRCVGASNVKVKSAAFDPYVRYVTTTGGTGPNRGLFNGSWKIVGAARTATVWTRCRDVLFTGSFTVKTGSMPMTGAPAFLTAGVGLALTTVGWLMLIAARSERVQPIAQAASSSAPAGSCAARSSRG